MDNCVQIGAGALRVEVAKPGTRYARSRFDWTGFIPQVTYNGKTFCTTEDAPGKTGGTGGEGFCNEFKADDANMGWDDTDRFFLKPGVGLLEKVNDKPYFFFTDYNVVQPFPCEMHAAESTVTFHQGAIAHKGIAYTLDKHIAVVENALFITSTLTNVGEKALQFSEYNHNFLSLNGRGNHPQITLTTNAHGKLENPNEAVVLNDQNLTFTAAPAKPLMIHFDAPPTTDPYWEMADAAIHQRIQEWGDFPLTKYAVWGVGHVLSPEAFGDFSIPVGQRRTWTRVWKFFA